MSSFAKSLTSKNLQITQLFQALNGIKSSLKLHTLSQSSGLNIMGQVSKVFKNSNKFPHFQEVELCRYFEKLFFQLLQLLERLNDIVNSVQNTSNSQVI